LIPTKLLITQLKFDRVGWISSTKIMEMIDPIKIFGSVN
jgi:hypothetical protein